MDADEVVREELEALLSDGGAKDVWKTPDELRAQLIQAFQRHTWAGRVEASPPPASFRIGTRRD